MARQKPPGFGQNLVDEKAFARGIQNHIHLWHKKAGPFGAFNHLWQQNIALKAPVWLNHTKQGLKIEHFRRLFFGGQNLSPLFFQTI